MVSIVHWDGRETQHTARMTLRGEIGYTLEQLIEGRCAYHIFQLRPRTHLSKSDTKRKIPSGSTFLTQVLRLQRRVPTVESPARVPGSGEALEQCYHQAPAVWMLAFCRAAHGSSRLRRACTLALTLSAPPDATRDPMISTHVITSLWWSTLLSMHVPLSRLHTMSCRSSPPDTISGMGLVYIYIYIYVCMCVCMCVYICVCRMEGVLAAV
jgi:hypothetical protein